MERTPLAVLALAIVASAADRGATARPRELGKQQQRVAGGTSQRAEVQARMIDQLIADLEDGRPVDPMEIDRALSAPGRR